MNRIKLVTVMILWGSIGLFTRYIPLTPIHLAFSRAVLGAILLVVISGRKSGALKGVNRTTLMLYSISGALIGLAWVALFYGYTQTTIATAVVIYNMCPVYVMLLAPILLKEKRSNIQTVVILLSLIGLVLIVGAPTASEGDLMGKIMSGISGLLYAVIVMINRKIKVKLNSNIATAIQMISASLMLLPFVIHSGYIGSIKSLDLYSVILTITLGIVHTGVAYSLYFSTYHEMNSINIVAYSYLEPVFGLIFSVIILRESLTVIQIVGGLLILGSTFVGENLQAGRWRIGRRGNRENRIG